MSKRYFWGFMTLITPSPGPMSASMAPSIILLSRLWWRGMCPINFALLVIKILSFYVSPEFHQLPVLFLFFNFTNALSNSYLIILWLIFYYYTYFFSLYKSFTNDIDKHIRLVWYNKGCEFNASQKTVNYSKSSYAPKNLNMQFFIKKTIESYFI